MPLLFLIGQHPVLVRMRSAGRDAAAGVEEELGWLLDQLRHAWPSTRIVLRTDSGFCREAILAACEQREGVDYVIGVARNPRLEEEIEIEMAEAVLGAAETKTPTRRFREFRSTLTSWSRDRRVIGKAEALPPVRPGGKGKENPRFIVTSLPAATHPARFLYEHIYCARGDAENRVKEHKLGLFSARCSSNLFDANALRFYLSTFAMILFRALREALSGTRTGRGQRGADPAPPAQDRSLGPDLGAARPHRHVLRLPRPGLVPHRLGTPEPHLTARPAAEPPKGATRAPTRRPARSVGPATPRNGRRRPRRGPRPDPGQLLRPTSPPHEPPIPLSRGQYEKFGLEAPTKRTGPTGRTGPRPSRCSRRLIHRLLNCAAGRPWRRCGSGGTGRRAGFRIQWGNPWGFESPLSHQPAAPRSDSSIRQPRSANPTGRPARTPPPSNVSDASARLPFPEKGPNPGPCLPAHRRGAVAARDRSDDPGGDPRRVGPAGTATLSAEGPTCAASARGRHRASGSNSSTARKRSRRR